MVAGAGLLVTAALEAACIAMVYGAPVPEDAGPNADAGDAGASDAAGDGAR